MINPYNYQLGIDIEKLLRRDIDWYAFLSILINHADTDNMAKLELLWPEDVATARDYYVNGLPEVVLARKHLTDTKVDKEI